jgi:hypothetical protein
VNADIPYLRCWVRRPFISDSVGTEEAYAFAIQSYPGRALAFHVMMKSGAHYRGVPINGIALQPDAPEIELGDCQLWDCFTFHPIVHCYSYLRDHEAICLTRSGPKPGTYLFTVDWLPDHNGPGWTHLPEQNKCGHVLALHCGNLVCLPTNRIAWKDGYFVGARPDPKSQGYKVQEHVYQAEDSAWDVSKDAGWAYAPEDGRSGGGTAGEPAK